MQRFKRVSEKSLGTILREQGIIKEDQLKNALEESGDGSAVMVFDELYRFIGDLLPVMDERIGSGSDNRTFVFWDKSHTIKEEYRKNVALVTEKVEIDIEKLKEYAEKTKKYIYYLAELIS